LEIVVTVRITTAYRMPTNPRWLLAIPDALTQLAASDRPLLTRRDLEQLFGVSKPQAAILMPAIRRRTAFQVAHFLSGGLVYFPSGVRISDSTVAVRESAVP
jgi:hypothetical protein